MTHKVEVNDDLWWAIFQDSEQTVVGHLRHNYNAQYFSPTHLQPSTADYIEFPNTKYYTLFQLTYSGYT